MANVDVSNQGDDKKSLEDSYAGDYYAGYMVGGNLTAAKNMVATVEYYDLKAKGGDSKDGHARSIRSELNITF